MSELKPCPFCGSEADVYTWRNELERINPTKIQCKMCGASTLTYDRVKQAYDAWNRRVGEGEKDG